ILSRKLQYIVEEVMEGFDRNKLETLLKQRFFYDQSFAIYGGVQGLYDFGPMGCAVKANLLQEWRNFFVLEEQMLEMDCSMLTPGAGAEGLRPRGEVKDLKTGECFRADHVVKQFLEKLEADPKTPQDRRDEARRILNSLDNLDGAGLQEVIVKFGIKSPQSGNEISEPQQFNLMFQVSIGPAGNIKGYLRPETAQGIFVNFKRLLEFNQGRLPVREFTMAEIEHFLDPADKSHPKFASAVSAGVIANQTLAYFMARIFLFMVRCGVDRQRLRFRQHLSNEMAHYACDCWDAECLTSYGWIECVGCADRSAYDLTQHSKACGAQLVAEKMLAEPQVVVANEAVINKGVVGRTFKADAVHVTQYLSSLEEADLNSLATELESLGSASREIGGSERKLTPDMVSVRRTERTVHRLEFVPSVIEPSFGIGRIMYVIFEHSFRAREGDEARTYLSLPPVIAPYKCSVLQLSNNPKLREMATAMSQALTQAGLSHRIDDSSVSIGKRYARTDQIAIPYGVTIDFDSINKTPATATLRERDSMRQVRVEVEKIPGIVQQLVQERLTWAQVMEAYPVFEQQETIKDTDGN
uniref:HGTP_anticodon domain-containing protein n=1 Tax=Macrostomum lignano TaxID=282301 RepID=A0A1I8HGV9_9PLAT